MPRRRALRVVAGVAAVLVLVSVVLVAVGASTVRRPLPDDSGAATLPGLGAEVRVLRDARGVAYIYADDAEDLFRAQGYVHAQDRFFEMDYRRHVTSGRLSELVGADEAALAADSAIRTFGWREVAEREWPRLAPDTRRWFEAYADGVNAYLAERDVESLGVEYALLGFRVDVPEPEPWDPIDSLAWLKAMAWDLRGNYDEELARALSWSTVRDVALVDQLFPRYPYDRNAPIVESAEAVDAPVSEGVDPALLSSPDLQRALDDARRALTSVPQLLGRGEGTGSNSWVVGGEYTASGRPLLANDPHLSLSAPGVWTQMGLYCTEVTARCPFEVAGFTFSGMPGVVIGHNADLAWGLTTLGADVTDFFVERIDPEQGTYLRDGEDVPLETRTEVIEVAGGEPVEIEVRSTVHGPIISDVLDVGRAVGSPLPEGPRRGVAEVSLAWTALEPGRTADAIFAMNLAQGPEDVAEAAALFDVPSQNIVWATTDGQIGYQAPGAIPLRPRVVEGPVPSDGTWPRPGWDSRYDWTGYVDPSEMPSVVDPPAGYVVAANQAVTAPGEGPFLTQDWDYGYRAQRIRTLLDEAVTAGIPVDAAAMSYIQNDQWSPYAEALLPTLLAAPVTGATPAEEAFTEEAVDLLREWDGVQSPDSAAAAYFSAVWATLLELTFHDDLPEAVWPSGDSRWLEVVVGILDEPDSPWWDDRRTAHVVESRDEILSRSLVTARQRLTVDLGKDAEGWEWGRLHQAAPGHPLGGDALPSLLRRLVNPDPMPVGGGSSIVDATSWDAATGSFEVTAGPSMRMVVDLGDLDASTWVTLTGTSGHPASVHYTDQFEAWARGDTFPWPFSRAAVAEASGRELVLSPSDG